MKLIFDHQAFTLQKYGGISTLYIELFKELDKLQTVHYSFPILYSDNDNLLQFKKPFLNKYFPFLNKIQFKQKIHLINVLNNIYSIVYLLLRFDNYHYIPTYYGTFLLPFIRKNKIILIIHDLIHEIYQIQDSLVLDGKKLLAEKSHIVIAVSQNTKNDIINYLKIPSNKIFVMYLATNIDKYISKSITTSTPYVLFVGNRSSYKNFVSFLTSYCEVAINHKIFIACIGGGNFNQDERILINSLGLDSHIRYYDYDNSILKYLYTNALFFCFPSKYEGFGIPLLEAMTCGCPIVTSNISSLPEVAGNAAIFFDPEDIHDMKEKLLVMTINPTLYEKYKHLSQLRSSQFSWQLTAQKFINIINEVK